MIEYKTTILKIAISSGDQNPVFGDGVTHVEIDNEAGGGYLVLSQGDMKINLNLDELVHITNVAKEMMADYDKQTGETR